MFQQSLQSRGFSQRVAATMALSRRQSSSKLYSTYLRQWTLFCRARHRDPFRASVAEALDFLQSLIDDDNVHRGYSTIATARSALSSVIILDSGTPFGSHPDVIRFMKGVYNMRPPTTRYTITWDTSVVVEFLKHWGPAQKLSLEKLTLKTVVLILLVSGRRGQVLPALTLDNMRLSDDDVTFYLQNSELKEGRLGHKGGAIKLKAFTGNKRLCVHHYILHYLKRTVKIRQGLRPLFLTVKKPHHPPSRDTFSRWVKTVLQLAGIDTAMFAPGSTRAAASSKAAFNGATLDQIMEGGGWSRPSTFTKFYKKPIKKQKKAFGDFVLK